VRQAKDTAPTATTSRVNNRFLVAAAGKWQLAEDVRQYQQ